MTVFFELQGIEFEWDDKKYAVDLRRHNVKFEKAAEVFFDELCQFGDVSVEEEKREFIIGFSFDFDLLFTIFCRTRRKIQNNLGTLSNAGTRKILCRRKVKR